MYRVFKARRRLWQEVMNFLQPQETSREPEAPAGLVHTPVKFAP